MNIPVDLLKTFAAVIDEGTLDRAAAALAVTPSAVSQRIRALESQLGRVVLARTRPVTATPDGETILRLARQLALLERDAQHELGIDSAETMTRVQLGVNADALLTWFLDALVSVSNEQRVLFEVHREDQDRTARLLESGTVMAAVTAQREPVAGCVSSPLLRVQYEAYASAEFFDRWFPDGVTREALMAAPRVDFDKNDVLQLRYLRSRRIQETGMRHIISDSAKYFEAIERGLGWGMLMPSQIAEASARRRMAGLGGKQITVDHYWQRWNLASPLLESITAAVFAAAGRERDRERSLSAARTHAASSDGR